MKLLIVQTGFLGDVVLSTPVITALRKVFPDATISVLTTPQGAELLASCPETHPYLDKILSFDKRGSQSGLRGLREMSLKLANEGFDAVFSLHKSWRTALMLWWAGIPRRFGFCEAQGTMLYTSTASRSDLLHEVDRNLAILRTVGYEPRAFQEKMFVGVSQSHISEAQRLLAPIASRPVVALAPGSAWRTKRWSESGFRELAQMLVQAGKSVVILGGPDEMAVGGYIGAGLNAQVLDLTGKISILTSAAIISRCSVLVANDSLALHLASAVGASVVALFCSTVPEFGFGPWGVPHKVLGIPALSCRPCGRHGRVHCPLGTYDCINMLAPSAVSEAVFELLERSLHKNPYCELAV